MSIPDVVRSTVLRRLARLDRSARAVVMRASVVGRDFDLQVLAAATARSETRVRAALEQACNLQLIRIAAEDRYSFRHALTRDIIYAEFLGARARPLHRRIARVLERRRQFTQVPLEELAYHAWAGADARRALHYNELAGDNAAAIHAGTDARRYYERARSLTAVESAAYARLTQKLDRAGGA
ncbi:MAG TPA: hypothetical protein VKR56_10525 [Candidatus Cybelea sp.]|nr:hypothetical protein [Candidatus Cybelea sp.]